jgi:hypothetical protein
LFSLYSSLLVTHKRKRRGLGKATPILESMDNNVAVSAPATPHLARDIDLESGKRPR